jgi:hypothetical protein
VKNDGTVFVQVVVIVIVTEVTAETDQNATMEDNDTTEANAGNEVTVTVVMEEATANIVKDHIETNDLHHPNVSISQLVQ